MSTPVELPFDNDKVSAKDASDIAFALAKINKGLAHRDAFLVRYWCSVIEEAAGRIYDRWDVK